MIQRNGNWLFRFLTIVCAISLNLATAHGQVDANNIIVSQQWLVDNMNNENIVILHVGSEVDYNTSHIQGARYISTKEFSTTNGNLRWEIPEKSSFTRSLASKGVSNETINVLYYGSEVFAPTFRLYFTMKYFGLGRNTYILDGGITGWHTNHRPSETRTDYTVEVKELNLQSNTSMIWDASKVLLASQRKDYQIIDARNNNFYTGETDGDGYYKRSGHIPSALNITWTQLLDENNFLRPKETLRTIFSKAGVQPEANLVMYCHVGLRATVLHTVGDMLGFKTYLYDGSYNEWDTLDDSFPIETGN